MEVRVPLLDAEITDIAVAADPRHHRRGGQERPLLRAAFGDRLQVAWGKRRKVDQPMVEAGRGQELERHRGAWVDRLERGVLESAGVVPREAARALLQAPGGGVRALYRALALVSLELWCRARGVDPD